jgi:hypothetical protein
MTRRKSAAPAVPAFTPGPSNSRSPVPAKNDAPRVEPVVVKPQPDKAKIVNLINVQEDALIVIGNTVRDVSETHGSYNKRTPAASFHEIEHYGVRYRFLQASTATELSGITWNGDKVHVLPSQGSVYIGDVANLGMALPPRLGTLIIAEPRNANDTPKLAINGDFGRAAVFLNGTEIARNRLAGDIFRDAHDGQSVIFRDTGFNGKQGLPTKRAEVETRLQDGSNVEFRSGNLVIQIADKDLS